MTITDDKSQINAWIEELEAVSATRIAATARRGELMIALADAGVTQSAIGIAAGIKPHGVNMALARARQKTPTSDEPV